MSESQEIQSADVPEVPENPLLVKLKKRVPGETFRLPSRGLFYTNGELDPEVDNGEVVVYPMNSTDELKMRNQDMLFQGTAITETIARCVPQILKPGKLIASDIDYLLTCLRKVSYGPLLPLKHKCRHCDAPEHEFNLSIDHFIRNAKEITQEQYDRTTIILDEAYTIKLRPCTFDEFIKVLQRSNQEFDSAEKVSSWLDASFAAVIRSVDNVKDKALIMEWLRELPLNVKEELSNEMERVNQWGVEFDFEIKCEKCGTPDNLSTSLNPTSFFTLPSSPKTKKQ